MLPNTLQKSREESFRAKVQRLRRKAGLCLWGFAFMAP
jgi:hypothetical protein